MKLAIFTTHHPVLSQTWINNEISILENAEIDFKYYYTSKSYSRRQSDYGRFLRKFVYIPLFPRKILSILKYCFLHLKLFCLFPVGYLRILFFISSYFRYEYIRDLFKLGYIFNSLVEFKPDIIYSHYIGDESIFVFFTSLLFGKKYGVIVHSYYTYPVWITEILTKADFILLKSDSGKRYVQEAYPGIPYKIQNVVPWGIDSGIFNITSNLTDINRTKIFTILSVSRFVPMKGLKYLLETCKILRNKNIVFRCEIVGYGQLKRIYEKYIRRNKLGKIIKLIPPIPHSKNLKRLLSEADVFVLPAVIDDKTGEQDFIPNAILEAMAMEKVVITTKVTGMQEAAKDGESIIFCKEKDPEDLADKIRMVMKMSQERRRDIGEKAREVVVKYYDKEKQGKKFVEFLKSQIQ